jgi:hypothetical protein
VNNARQTPSCGVAVVARKALAEAEELKTAQIENVYLREEQIPRQFRR